MVEAAILPIFNVKDLPLGTANPILKPDVKAANKNSFPDTYVN